MVIRTELFFKGSTWLGRKGKCLKPGRAAGRDSIGSWVNTSVSSCGQEVMWQPPYLPSYVMGWDHVCQEPSTVWRKLWYKPHFQDHPRASSTRLKMCQQALTLIMSPSISANCSFCFACNMIASSCFLQGELPDMFITSVPAKCQEVPVQDWPSQHVSTFKLSPYLLGTDDFKICTFTVLHI